MRDFHGCWRGSEGVEALECFVADGAQTLLHTLHRATWDDPRVDIALPFEPGATVARGDLVIRAALNGSTLELEVQHLGTRVLHQRRTVHGATMTVDTTGPDGTGSTTLQRAPVKQVLLYRRDLQMRKGKIAAQCAHASLKVVLDRNTAGGPRIEAVLPGPMAVWVRSGFAKIVLSVEDEAALDHAAELAAARGIPHARITDAGRTEFHGVPTRTTVALGPWEASAIDAITGPEGLIATKLA